MRDKKNHKGFSKDYWDENYSSPMEMDGIGNAREHALYLKYLLSLDLVEVKSIVDLGFGLGHLFREVVNVFKPYKAFGIEPSEYAFKQFGDQLHLINKETKVKIENTDLLSWCRNQKYKKHNTLGICTSVFQYLENEEIEEILPILAQRFHYLYFSVPTDKELDRQVKEVDFKDEYAIRRSKTYYTNSIKPHFTFISNRFLESKYYFDSESSFFTDLLFRF